MSLLHVSHMFPVSFWTLEFLTTDTPQQSLPVQLQLGLQATFLKFLGELLRTGKPINYPAWVLLHTRALTELSQNPNVPLFYR